MLNKEILPAPGAEVTNAASSNAKLLTNLSPSVRSIQHANSAHQDHDTVRCAQNCHSLMALCNIKDQINMCECLALRISV